MQHNPRLRRLGYAVRDIWLIGGVTVLLFLGVEALYRLQGAVRRALRRPAAQQRLWTRADHPNAREAWWKDVVAGVERPGTHVLRYDPFRGWWPAEHHGRYVNSDSVGRRVTLQPRTRSAVPRKVYMFGGSVMWGWLVRDSSTIPSLVAHRLHALGYQDIEVMNLAQSTFDLAQNAATLWQELRHGRAPVIAVFLDGNNEVAPVFQSGIVGSILNQSLIARRFDRRTDFGSDVMALLRHSELVQRVTQRATAQTDSDRSQLCGAVAGSYARQVEMIDALAKLHRFTATFLWQPMRATSAKPLTAWERSVGEDETWAHMIRKCTNSVDSAMASHRSVQYVPLHALFDRDSGTVFIDDYGHMTEAANRVVAERIAQVVADRLGSIIPRRGSSQR